MEQPTGCHIYRAGKEVSYLLLGYNLYSDLPTSGNAEPGLDFKGSVLSILWYLEKELRQRSDAG